MDLSLGLTTSMPVSSSVLLAKKVEKLEYSRVWVGEDIPKREIFTYLSILALNTREIGLGTGITSPYVRDKVILSTSIQAMYLLLGDRFILGIGAGGLPEIEEFTGRKPSKPLSVLEDTTNLVMDKFDTSVYFGIRGPKMLELAGRIADGVILSGPKSYISKAVKIIDDAANGREVRKVLWNAFILDGTQKDATKITSIMLESMPEFALAGLKDNPENELCIFGSVDEILEEAKNYEELGIDELVVGPPYGKNPEDVIRRVGEAWI